MKYLKYVMPIVLCMVFFSSQAAPKPDDHEALKGVTKGKVVFDINMESPRKMTLYLMVIEETVDDLLRQGVEPDVVLAFRGKSVNLISTNREHMELEDFQYLDRIAQQLKGLRAKGTRIEACSVATRLFKIDNQSLLEGIKPVGNTFVSLTGYQAQGYANIPIY